MNPDKGRAAVQLTLAIGLRGTPTFRNFVDGPNAEVRYWVERVARGEGPDLVYLWGPASSGKSHLLEAACHAVAERGQVVSFVPLGEGVTVRPDMLEGLEFSTLVCLDDVGAVAGVAAWEEALFHLLNRLRAAGRPLLVAGKTAPSGLGIVLPDLASRLEASLVLRLAPLADPDCAEALKRRALDRGFQVPEDVATYLLRRCPRDLKSLLAMLDRLDEASLSAGRRVTLPLLRGMLGEGERGRTVPDTPPVRGA